MIYKHIQQLKVYRENKSVLSLTSFERDSSSSSIWLAWFSRTSTPSRKVLQLQAVDLEVIPIYWELFRPRTLVPPSRMLRWNEYVSVVAGTCERSFCHVESSTNYAKLLTLVFPLWLIDQYRLAKAITEPKNPKWQHWDLTQKTHIFFTGSNGLITGFPRVNYGFSKPGFF